METSTNYSKTAGVRRADKSENTTLFRNVYLWMTMALFITGATALTVSDSPTLLNAIFGSKVAFFGLIIAELALVIILSSFIFRMSFLTATLMFIAYSILNGATLASIFLLYTASSIASTFFVTAGTFGAMALFGYFTKRDLSGIREHGLHGAYRHHHRNGGEPFPAQRNDDVGDNLHRRAGVRRPHGL